jgi:hypothetical protein
MMAKLTRRMSWMFLAIVVSGCGGSDEPKPASVAVKPPAVAPKAATSAEAKASPSGEAGWGNLSGRIAWGGDVPKRAPLKLGGNDAAICQKDGPILDETWIVSEKNKGLKNTFVWLEAPKGQKLPIHSDLAKVPSDKVQIDQPHCMFIPHALAIREGQILEAKNSSPIAHNFKWQGSPGINEGNKLVPPPGRDFELALKADRLPVTFECNIHPWMRGYVRVFDHPYFAVTNEDGAFKIDMAPAGEWRLKIWHGSGGWAGGVAGREGRPITVKAGENDLGVIEYPAPK